MALSFETYKTFKVVGVRRKHWAIRFHFKMKQKNWMIDWMNVKISLLKSGVCKISKIVYTRRTHPHVFNFFPSVIPSFIHSFFLSDLKPAFLARGVKKTDPSDQCNLRNYPKYFYSYIDVTMPIVAFYLSGTALTTKCLFNHQQSAWTIPCWIHPISSDLGS